MDEDKPQLSPKKEKDFILTALGRFQISAEAEQENRRTALEADKFSTGDQWPDQIRTGRETGPSPRPTLVVDKVDPAVRQVVNDARQNRPQAKVIPADDGDEETAEILEGMLRYIQVGSNSDIAVDVGFDQMVRGGWGYMRVLTDYCDDKSFNQDIKIKPIRNRFTVFCDPFCTEPDYSDMQWCFVVDDIPNSEFKKKYPKAEMNGIDFSSVGDNAEGWKTSKTTRVAEYWVVDYVTTKLYETPDGQVTDIPPPPPMQSKREREVQTPKVTMYKITASEILETNEWAGRYIPIIPIIGQDHDIDGKRKLRGIVTQMMDSQRMYNYMSSAAIEAIALAPKTPWLATAGQIEGYEHIWARANVENYSHLPYNATDTNGVLHPQPSRNTAEPPIQAMMMAIRQASEDMQSTSGMFDPSMGKTSGYQSGKAINSLQRQGQISTFHFVDNLSRALRYLGVILLDLIPRIYDAPRIVRIVHEDGTHEQKEVNQHLKPGYEQPQEGQEAVAKVFDVTAISYDVVITTGPSYNTKRQEALDATLSVSQAYPALWQIGGDLMVKNMDWPGADDLAERFRKTPTIAQLTSNEEGPQVPPQIKAQMEQYGQMVEQLSQALNAAQDELESKTAELTSKEKIAAQNNETAVAIAAIRSENTNNLALLREELGHLRAQQDLAHQKEVFAHQKEQAAQQAQVQQAAPAAPPGAPPA